MKRFAKHIVIASWAWLQR